MPGVNWRPWFWAGLAAVGLAFWAAVVLVQGKWLSPRAWGGFALAALIARWWYGGRIDVSTDGAGDG